MWRKKELRGLKRFNSGIVLNRYVQYRSYLLNVQCNRGVVPVDLSQSTTLIKVDGFRVIVFDLCFVILN